MKFSKEEKEIIRVIVECENKGGNLAFVLNFSRLLEKKGIGIVSLDYYKAVFLRKDMYPDYEFDSSIAPYVSTLFNLIEKLISEKHLICRGCLSADPLVVGVEYSQWKCPNVIAVNGEEVIMIEGPYQGWYGADRYEKYWMCDDWNRQLSKIDNYLYSSYSVSEELRDLVKHHFKTEEEIRFAKQQLMTWISIGVAILVGILGIIF